MWATFVVLQVLAAARADQRGLAAVTQARRELSAADLLVDRPLGPLAIAQGDFRRAHHLLQAGWLAPVRFLPILGRQLRAVDDLSASAERVSRVGAETVAAVASALRQPHTTGPQRLVELAEISSAASRADQQLAHLAYGPGAWLVSPIATRRGKLIDEVAKVRAELNKAALATGVIGQEMTAGTRYLLFGANNAEMRSGSGMLLQGGVLTVKGGDLTLGPTTATEALALPPPGVPISGDLAARWGWLRPNQDFRNLATTPQFDVTAPLAARMWQAATGQHVDGVLVLDDVAIQALLAATGPVSVSGATVGADNALTFLTETQYLQADETARKEMLGALAQATAAKVQQGQVSLSTLAAGLADATAGRHVLLWSSNPGVQAAYQTLGVAGLVGPHGLLVSVLNGGGNKLDPYLNVGVHLSLERSSRFTQVTIRVDLANRAPAGLPSYVVGTGNAAALGELPGEYAGLLAAYLPGAATNAHIAGQSFLAVDGREGPLAAVAVPFRLLPGHHAEFVVSFELPGHHGTLAVTPSARIPAVEWQAPAVTFSDRQARSISY